MSQTHQEKKIENPNTIRNERGEVTTNSTEMQSIIRDYDKQLYANKVDNQEEIDKLQMPSLLRLNQ